MCVAPPRPRSAVRREKSIGATDAAFTQKHKARRTSSRRQREEAATKTQTVAQTMQTETHKTGGPCWRHPPCARGRIRATPKTRAVPHSFFAVVPPTGTYTYSEGGYSIRRTPLRDAFSRVRLQARKGGERGGGGSGPTKPPTATAPAGPSVRTTPRAYDGGSRRHQPRHFTAKGTPAWHFARYALPLSGPGQTARCGYSRMLWTGTAQGKQTGWGEIVPSYPAHSRPARCDTTPHRSGREGAGFARVWDEPPDGLGGHPDLARGSLPGRRAAAAAAATARERSRWYLKRRVPPRPFRAARRTASPAA